MQVEYDPNGGFKSEARGVVAVQAQAQLLAAHLRNQLLMRLGLYILAAIFIITAALLIVFAPSGRESLTTIVALAMFALAVGIAGFGAFTIKIPGVEATASRVQAAAANIESDTPSDDRSGRSRTQVAV